MGICRTPIVVPSEEEGEEQTTSDWVIFVPNTIPGELVRLSVYRNYKSYSDADLLEVVEESEFRVTPLCPLAESCGGCQYQHMAIPAQREWKTNQVRDVLERIGDLDNPDVTPTVGTDDVWHYRSKITPHYEAPTKIGEGSYQIREIGFKVKNSRKLLDVPYCHIATEAINEELTVVRATRRQDAFEGNLKKPKKGATLLFRDVNEGVVTDNTQYVTTTVAGLTFRFMAGNFFQNNPFMLPVMVDHVVAAATTVSGNNNNSKMTHLIDCYCGSGLFSLSTAASFDVCVGIEVNEKAIEEARQNAELNGIDNCAFVAASAEAIFDSTTPVEGDVLVQDFPRDTTVIVCDPPRKGCSEEFLDQLYAFGSQRIV